jgi:hypothetical protein
MICRIVVSAFVLAYAVALVALVVGVFGLFGAERDRLAAMFLVPLGMPWTFLVGRLPDAMRPVAAALTPLVNLALLVAVCRARRRTAL